MSKPDRRIVVALLEVYLSMRSKEDWWNLHLTDDKKISDIPTDDKIRSKLESALAVLRSLPHKKSKTTNPNLYVNRWIDVLKALHAEETKHANIGWWYDSLQQTMKAIRCYIITELENEDIFKKRIENLSSKDKPSDDEKNELSALTLQAADKNFLAQFFNNVIKPNDLRSQTLQEDNVDEFKANALNVVKRPAKWSKALLRTFPRMQETAEIAKLQGEFNNKVVDFKTSRALQQNSLFANKALPPAEVQAKQELQNHSRNLRRAAK